MSKVLVLYYSSYGRIEAMANAVAREGGRPAHTLTSSTVVTAIPRIDLRVHQALPPGVRNQHDQCK
jgi:hypothetical protein